MVGIKKDKWEMDKEEIGKTRNAKVMSLLWADSRKQIHMSGKAEASKREAGKADRKEPEGI